MAGCVEGWRVCPLSLCPPRHPTPLSSLPCLLPPGSLWAPDGSFALQKTQRPHEEELLRKMLENRFMQKCSSRFQEVRWLPFPWEGAAECVCVCVQGECVWGITRGCGWRPGVAWGDSPPTRVIQHPAGAKVNAGQQPLAWDLLAALPFASTHSALTWCFSWPDPLVCPHCECPLLLLPCLGSRVYPVNKSILFS